MKIVDRHLSGAFLRTFSFSVTAFLLLSLVVDFLEQLRIILKHKAQLGPVLLFLSARLPWIAAQVIPMATLLGTLLALIVLSRHGEITALRCGGVTLRRLALPFTACGLAIALLTGFIQEVAAPRGFAFAREVKEVRIKGRPPRVLRRTQNLWLRSGSRLIHVARVGETPAQLLGVSIVELAQHRIARRIDAREAIWNGESWTLVDGVMRTFQPDGTFDTAPAASVAYPLAESPEAFEIARLEPEETSWVDLRRRIQRYRAQGIDTRELEVGLWAKTSLPFTNLVMPLLAFPFGIRAGRRGSPSRGVVLAVALGFAYWLVLAGSLSLGKAGVLPAPLAAWAANLLFCAVSSLLLWRAEGAS